jgi:aminoglycoside phosphotransferase (APT) family kinase protein
MTGRWARETAVSRVMTSTSVQRHPTALGLTGLPVLSMALDPLRMTERLAPLLDTWAVGGVHPTVTYARLLAYKRGNRGAIEYVVDGLGPVERVVGKLYPDAGRAARVESLLHQLGCAFTDAPGATPRPIGCVTELAMLVYVPVEGRLLDEVLFEGAPDDGTPDVAVRCGPDADRAVDLLAAWLGRFHGAHLELDRRWVPADEAVDIAAWVALVEHLAPDDAGRAHDLAADLQARAARIAFRSDTPVHRDLHHHHVLVDEGVGVIDLDEVRAGDPSLDVAHLCVHLQLLGIRSPRHAADLRRLEERFLARYRALTGWEADERYTWCAGYTCLKIVKQLCTVRGVRPRPDGDEQRRQLHAMLVQGWAGDGVAGS